MGTGKSVGFGILIYGLFLVLMGVGELILILPVMLLSLDGSAVQFVPLIVERILQAWPLLGRKIGQITAGVILSVTGAGLIGRRPWAMGGLKRFLWAALFIVPMFHVARIAQLMGSQSRQSAVLASVNLLLNLGGIVGLLVWLRRARASSER